MKYIFTLIAIILSATLSAQYTSPDAGLTIDLNYLVQNSNGAVLFEEGQYIIHENITIAPTDVFEETSVALVAVAESVLITIQGGFSLVTDGILITWTDEGSHYDGFRFEEGSAVTIQNTIFEYGGGLKVLTGDFHMWNSVVRYQETIASTGGAVGLSTGKPTITNCIFVENVSAAINSAANSEVAPVIENCIFQYNGTDVLNAPQISLGPSGADTTIIRGNNVEGHPDNFLSGGIAVSSLAGLDGHAIIENNEVFNNRYGIAAIGSNLNSVIRQNLIYDNNTEADPMVGGSGINLNSGGFNYAVVSENIITGNLWGMTMQGTSSANLGDTNEANYNPGLNVFEGNGNGGDVFALYNNTPNDVMAMNNCWDGFNNITETEAEALITHQPDIPSLGLVTYTPLGNCTTVGVEEPPEVQLNVFPNPVRDLLNVQTEDRITLVSMFDIRGQLLSEIEVSDTVNSMSIQVSDLPSGIYLLKVTTINGMHTERFVKD